MIGVIWCTVFCIVMWDEFEEEAVWLPIVCLFIAVCLIVGNMNTVRGYFRFDEEKIVFRKITTVEIIYYRDIEYFGWKRSVPVARKTGNSYISVKTKEKIYHPDLFLKEENMNQLTELKELMKLRNPAIVINL